MSKSNLYYFQFLVSIGISCFCILPAMSQNITLIGQRTYGGSGDDYGRHIALLADGSFLASGESRSSINGDKTEDNRGLHDYWLIKFSPGLNEIWQRTYGGDAIDMLYGTEELNANGDLLVAGSSASGISGDKMVANSGGVDFWVLRLDANGSLIWQQTYGGFQDDFLSTMLRLPNGTILLGGTSQSGVSGNRTIPLKGLSDYWLVCIDENGNKLWDRSYGGERRDSLTSMALDSNGHILLLGSSDSNIGMDKSENRFGNEGVRDGWILKLDSDWNPVWDRTIGGTSEERHGSITVDANRIFATMMSYSDASGTKSENQRGYGDYWIQCLDTAGNILWDRTIGGNSYEDLSPRTKLISDGRLMLFGGSKSDASFEKDEDSKGSYDLWPVIVDTMGTLVWQATIGGDSIDGPPIDGFELDPGHFVLLASSMSGISGDKTEEGRGIRDFWLVEIASSVGISETEPLELSMYPNPAYEQLQITWKDAANGCAGLIQLFDADGHMVQQQSMKSTTATISTGQLPQGIYTVTITDCKGNRATERLVRLKR